MGDAEVYCVLRWRTTGYISIRGQWIVARLMSSVSEYWVLVFHVGAVISGLRITSPIEQPLGTRFYLPLRQESPRNFGQRQRQTTAVRPLHLGQQNKHTQTRTRVMLGSLRL